MRRIGIIAATFYSEMASSMIAAAERRLQERGGIAQHVAKVPGCYDMPLPTKQLLEREDIDAVILLGAVIQGKTDHDIIVAETAARKASDLAVEHGKPVALGIIGPRATKEQAEARKEEYARRAVDAVFSLLETAEKIT